MANKAGIAVTIALDSPLGIWSHSKNARNSFVMWPRVPAQSMILLTPLAKKIWAIMSRPRSDPNAAALPEWSAVRIRSPGYGPGADSLRVTGSLTKVAIAHLPRRCSAARRFKAPKITFVQFLFG